MKYFILLILLASCAVKKSNQNSSQMHHLSDESLAKWHKAVINLESRSEIDGRAESGTAVFVEYKNVPFLLTARHVIADRLDENYAPFWKILIAYNEERVNVRLEKPFLMLLGATPEMVLYSSIDDDIAIVNLSIEKSFVRTLRALDYSPISLDDIDSICDLSVGEDISAFGFTQDFYRWNIDQKQPESYEENWRSVITSLPVIAHGKVGELFPGENFFSANILVSHGNSGGPIVRDNKLVGIVSAALPQFAYTETTPKLKYVKAGVKLIKSNIIVPMIKDSFAKGSSTN